MVAAAAKKAWGGTERQKERERGEREREREREGEWAREVVKEKISEIKGFAYLAQYILWFYRYFLEVSWYLYRYNTCQISLFLTLSLILSLSLRLSPSFSFFFSKSPFLRLYQYTSLQNVIRCLTFTRIVVLPTILSCEWMSV